jgi:hypothetical protein
VLLETETDTERRENVLAARFRDTERESAGVGLTTDPSICDGVVDLHSGNSGRTSPVSPGVRIPRLYKPCLRISLFPCSFAPTPTQLPEPPLPPALRIGNTTQPRPSYHLFGPRRFDSARCWCSRTRCAGLMAGDA